MSKSPDRQRRARLTAPRARLLGAFVAHNLEEVLAFNGLPVKPEVLDALHIDPGWYRRDRFAAATVMLTVVVAALTGSVDTRRSRSSAFVGAAATGALIANAAGHLGRTAATSSYNPGTASAPVLLVAGVASLRRICQNEDLPVRDATVAAAIGAVASLPAIVASLALSRALIR